MTKSKQLEINFINTLDDPGEREREFLSSLSAMEDAFSNLKSTLINEQVSVKKEKQ